MHAQWVVDNNPQAHTGARHAWTVCPQTLQAVPRFSERMDAGRNPTRIERRAVTPLDANLAANLSWAGGPPAWSATTVAVEGLNRLWVDMGSGLVEQYRVRSSGELTTAGQWAYEGSTLSVYALITDPGTLGWTILRDSDTVLVTDHGTSDARYLRNLNRRRYIEHPTLGGFEYPHPPTRTLNYFHFAMRQHDINAVKTLQGSVTVRDLYSWEDVVITEIWEGKDLSMLSTFFDSLHRIRTNETAIGRYCRWTPKDLSYASHSIIPISLTVGSSDMDLRAYGERKNSKNDSYLDRTVAFSFRLARPGPVMDTFMIMEGY